MTSYSEQATGTSGHELGPPGTHGFRGFLGGLALDPELAEQDQLAQDRKLAVEEWDQLSVAEVYVFVCVRVKVLYSMRYPLDQLDATDQAVGGAGAGPLWVLYVGRGLPAARRVVQKLAEVKVLYNMRYPLDHLAATDQAVGGAGAGPMWVLYVGRGVSAERRAAQKLAEVKVRYNMRYPLGLQGRQLSARRRLFSH